MPLINAFYGILIYMYWLDTMQHNLADWTLAIRGEPTVKSWDCESLLL
jgi:hypothetical protein